MIEKTFGFSSGFPGDLLSWPEPEMQETIPTSLPGRAKRGFCNDEKLTWPFVSMG
jgi:hypothetical protein